MTAITVLLTVCCERTDQIDRGQIVLSSAFNFDMATVQGYNFDLGKRTSYPSSGEALPDIVVDQYRRIDGTVKPGFTSPSNPDGFALAGAFSTVEESLDYFNSQLQSFDPEAAYSPSTDTVTLFQVWVLKTNAGNYAKLHVNEIREASDASGEYIEVIVDYYYQPNGVPEFPD
ncbi:MAG: hypothetical protein WD052_09690 [Bacteroidales bacterium]